MKNLIYFLFLAPFVALAQSSVLELAANESCECANKINFENLNEGQVEMQLGLCIINSYTNNKSAIEKHYGKSFSIDGPEFEKFAEDIGITMVGICPDIFMNFMDSEDFMDDSEPEYFISSGEIVKVEKPQFLMLHLKDENNSIQKFIFLYDAINSNLLRDPKFLNGKNVQIDYSKIELYDPVIDDFRSYNVIEEINLK